MFKKNLICLGLSVILLITGVVPAKAAVSAGDSIKIKDYSTNKVVNKTAIVAKYNNKTIKTNMPGFIDQNTAFYSAYWVFGHCSELGTSYSYSSKTKKITFKRGSSTVVMKLGSTSATLNNKTFKLSAAPKKVYYYGNKKNYIMVPGGILAEKLGFSYQWDKTNKAGLITKKASESDSNTNSNSPDPDSDSNSTSTTTAITPDTKIKASANNYSIRIKKPSGLNASAITANDDYWNKRLQLVIKGNYKSHFSSSSNRTIKDSLTYSVSYSNGNTYVNLKTSSIKGFSATQTSSYVYVKYAAPKSMFSRVIVVDAGHGGNDSGAVGNGYYEKNMTLKIVRAIKTNFDKDSKYKVYYTRLSDTYPSLSYRYNMANEVNADRFLSVHINSASSSARGTETLYKTYKTYANKIQKQALNGMGYSENGSYDRGLKYRTDLAVLNGPKMTTALVEMGFITNKTEASRINSRTSTIGSCLYKAICDSF